MACLLCFNSSWMELLLKHTLYVIGHSSKSQQYAYGKCILQLTRIDVEKISNFYEERVVAVMKHCRTLNALLSSTYRVVGTFYVVADFSALIGKKMNAEACKVLLKKSSVIVDDRDIAYHLLFECDVCFNAMSDFGCESTRGLMRITCCFTPSTFDKIFKRISGQF